MPKASDYLQIHGNSWRVRLIVPARLQDYLGCKVLQKSLGTSSKAEAEQRKWPIVAEFKATIHRAERAATTDDPIEQEALRARLFIELGDTEHDAGDGEVYIANDEADWAEERAHQIAVEHGEATAHRYANIAFGRHTPLTEFVEVSCQDRDLEQKTRGDLERTLGWLKEWLLGAGRTDSLQAVDRKLAGEFVRGRLLVDRGPTKAASYLSALRSYWGWMIRNGYLPDADNPWKGLEVTRRKRDLADKIPKRPYTDEEIVHLLNGSAPQDLSFLMRVAALSGMRISEVLGLTLAQCSDGLFRIPAGKTVNARRVFPIHPDLMDEINERSKQYAPSSRLVWSSAHEPEKALSKSFTRYRRHLGIGTQKGTNRDKSDADFHSFRRWFIRKFRDALMAGASGFDQWTLAGVVGHADEDRPKTLDLSQLHYAGEDGMEQKRALIESIQLPPGVSTVQRFARPPKRKRN